MIDIHPLNGVARERFLEILREQNAGLEPADGGKQRKGEGRTHRLPIFTHLRLFPSLDPTGVCLELANASIIVVESKT